MPRLALYLFGPPRMERDGRLITTDTRKAIALLAYLAVTRQRHSRDTLATLLWPEYDQTHARATLRRTLSTLNKALAGPWLQIDRDTISLNRQNDFWLDVDEFHTLLEQCRTHQHPSTSGCDVCLRALNQAVALCTADFMAGFGLQDSAGFDDWQFARADSLRHQAAGALEQLAQDYSARGELETAILHTRHLLTLNPLHEAAHRSLIQLYAWAGQRTASLQQYQECVKILDKELGVAPLEATTQLYEAIRANHVPPSPARHLPSSSVKLAPAAFSLQEQTSPAERLSTRSSGNYPLVGRQHEWDTLLRIYKEKAHMGYCIALEGEAGIGKTRLAEEFSAYARIQGAHIVTVRCYEGEMDLAYVPIAAGLRAAIKQQREHWQERLPPHWLGEVVRLLPELAELRPGLPVSLPLESPGAQSRFFEGLLQLWFALSASTPAGGPCLLFLDDIHWADDASLEFLSYLARRLSQQPLCLLLTWRTVQRAALRRLQHLLAETQRHEQAALFTLSRLDQPAVAYLVRQAAPDDRDLAGDLARRLYQETEGVPFFLTEYLSAMAGGLLKPGDEQWDLPHGVRDVLVSRLAVMNGTGRQLLGTAAVIGRSFDFDTLREVSGRSEEETIAGLEELIGQGLVQEIRGNSRTGSENTQTSRASRISSDLALAYDFCHEKMRGLVYEEMTLARRRLLHRRIAEVLIARLRGQYETGALAGQIAHHSLAAGNTETAARYFCQAGEYARSLYAHSEALAHFRSALTLGHPETAYLQETIGDLHTFLGAYESALKSYRLAQGLRNDPQSRAMLEHKQGKVYERRGHWELAQDHYAAALRLLDQLEQEQMIEERARINADWSFSAHHQGQYERALALAQRARDLAEAAGATRSLAQVYNLLGILANSEGKVVMACAHLERSLALADTSMRVAALNNLALACRARGENARAIELTERALALCIVQGDRHREAALHNNLADLFHEAGRTGESMSQLESAALIYSEIDVEAGTMQPEIWKLVEW